MTYFKNIETLEQLRKVYRDLLKKYHPDNGGSEEITKAINSEYEQLFKVLKDRHESKTAGTENKKASYSNTKYNYEEDAKLREMIQKIIYFEGINIEICGSWLWISGNTYQYKKELKALGFKWASTKKQWYWHSEEVYIKKSHKSLSMEAIRNYYGSTAVEPDKKLRLEA